MTAQEAAAHGLVMVSSKDGLCYVEPQTLADERRHAFSRWGTLGELREYVLRWAHEDWFPALSELMQASRYSAAIKFLKEHGK